MPGIPVHTFLCVQRHENFTASPGWSALTAFSSSLILPSRGKSSGCIFSIVMVSPPLDRCQQGIIARFVVVLGRGASTTVLLFGLCLAVLVVL